MTDASFPVEYKPGVCRIIVLNTPSPLGVSRHTMRQNMSMITTLKDSWPQ